MKYKNTKASECRWSEFAEQNWGDWDFLWEEAEVDYQGYAKILATKDGRFVYCEWSYGSCSGCDPWESMDVDAAKADFDKSAVYFENGEELVKFAKQVNYGDSFNKAIMTFIFEEEILRK
jgi:hypothetical protein